MEQFNTTHDYSSAPETLPQQFTVRFRELSGAPYPQVKVTLNGDQLGDVIDDNYYQNDGYRYHDVFHYTFATLLNWSPCARAMMKRKRKSDAALDRVEDGARAMITEEAISLILFNEAKSNDFYQGDKQVDDRILDIIINMTSGYEVATKSKSEWNKAILKSYEMFRLLRENNGGLISFNAINKTIEYSN